MLKWLAIVWVGVMAGCASAALAAEIPHSPRIVNIYNFIRNSDYRVPHSEDVLFDATQHQVHILKAAGLPATWALQYDALINPRYQQLLKSEMRKGDEVAAWWELPEPLVKKAGIAWRGEHEWDSRSNVGFSPGYSVEERKKLVDVYMAEFRNVFGFYPRSVGSWYIDEATLSYLVDRYGVIASCNCKDQVGTDGYTLWGGYWNQAYYPSRLNAYMPAQTKNNQIDIPIFRMLGSDPIYQYGAADRITTLEPVYPWAGGSPAWVNWFVDKIARGPCLAFAYTQAGQENSFGWDTMRVGYTLQVDLLARKWHAGDVRVETLADSGAWFKRNFEVTPATAFVAGDDWKNEGHKTAWYNSRYYRANFLWEKDALFIRDLHLFDERVISPTHTTPLKATSLAYETLPVMDGSIWSSESVRAGLWPVLLGAGTRADSLLTQGEPEILESDGNTLVIRQKLADGGNVTITCGENFISCQATDASGKPLHWAWELRGNERMTRTIRGTAANSIAFESAGTNYSIGLQQGTAEASREGFFRMISDEHGVLRLNLSAN